MEQGTESFDCADVSSGNPVETSREKKHHGGEMEVKWQRFQVVAWDGEVDL